MITRVVHLRLDTDRIDDFMDFFSTIKSTIISDFKCESVALYRENAGNEFFTISRWPSDEALEEYRSSDFFRTIWPEAKKMFASSAEAWSLTPVNL